MFEDYDTQTVINLSYQPFRQRVFDKLTKSRLKQQDVFLDYLRQYRLLTPRIVEQDDTQLTLFVKKIVFIEYYIS